MIDKKIVSELVKEIKEADQQYLNDNNFESLNDSQQSTIYLELGKMHSKEAKTLYNEAWQSYEMLEQINPRNAEQLSNQIGQMGLAHQFMCQQYKKEAFDLGQLEQIL